MLFRSDNANGKKDDKYITVTVSKKNVEEARSYFARAGAELAKLLAAIDSHCETLTAIERLQILYDVYRDEGNNVFSFDMKDSARKGHSFKDRICPDSVEKHADYLKLGEKYVRVMYLKDYANYIKDSMVTELMELNRNMMLSIDVVPVPTDEAVREVENRLLGIELTTFRTSSAPGSSAIKSS